MIHLFHKWSKWVQYEEHGVAGTLLFDRIRSYVETRESRKCETCGTMQDRSVKQGPMNKVQS